MLSGPQIACTIICDEFMYFQNLKLSLACFTTWKKDELCNELSYTYYRMEDPRDDDIEGHTNYFTKQSCGRRFLNSVSKWLM